MGQRLSFRVCKNLSTCNHKSSGRSSDKQNMRSGFLLWAGHANRTPLPSPATSSTATFLHRDGWLIGMVANLLLDPR